MQPSPLLHRQIRRKQDHYQRNTIFKACPSSPVFQASESIHRLFEISSNTKRHKHKERNFKKIYNTTHGELQSSIDEISSVPSNHQILQTKTYHTRQEIRVSMGQTPLSSKKRTTSLTSRADDAEHSKPPPVES
ncbi:hypothetical protein N665_0049s0037 [Sinapis alba]|nr:hypothetical protein N665_0049s0037 [Sinapis alba]